MVSPLLENRQTLFFFLSDRVSGLTRLIRFHRKTTSNNCRHCSSLGLIPIGSLREVKCCPVLLGGGRLVLKVKEGRYCSHSWVVPRANYYWCNQFLVPFIHTLRLPRHSLLFFCIPCPSKSSRVVVDCAFHRLAPLHSLHLRLC